MRPRLRTALLPALLLAICFGLTADWLSAKTTRLYVDASAEHLGEVRQEFKVRGKRVVPEITTGDAAVFRFAIDPHVPQKLIFSVKSAHRASYEIVAEGGTRQLIKQETVDRSMERSISIPLGSHGLEIVAHGSMRWSDLRVERPVFLWPFYLLAMGAVLFLAVREPKWFRGAEWITLSLATVICLGAAEFVLRRCAARLPAALIAARSELGALGEDSRAFDPARYRVRLRSNLRTYLEWQHGGIVKLGFIPAEVSPGLWHRYPLRTDAEGFRNESVRKKIDVAALGDSFTDGAMGPVGEAWPQRLEKIAHLAVQNYGTSGFGPQQELYVLQDFALQHQPRWAVVAFYAGNDLRDAEAFDGWEHSKQQEHVEREGWELARSFHRYETFYLWTLARVGIAPLARLFTHPSHKSETGVVGSLPKKPRFDRGMFTIPVVRDAVQFAFLPPYLQQLASPREEIEQSRGWNLAAEALRYMKEECAKNNTALLLMFVPEKAQVYWPLAERSFSHDELQDAVNFYCPPAKSALSIDAVSAHRLALNEMVQEFCTREGIPMLDLTASLQHEVESGTGTYIPDDPHWNAAGDEVAARALAEFLARQP